MGGFYLLFLCLFILEIPAKPSLNFDINLCDLTAPFFCSDKTERSVYKMIPFVYCIFTGYGKELSLGIN